VAVSSTAGNKGLKVTVAVIEVFSASCVFSPSTSSPEAASSSGKKF
jgi:hypothetical protein